MAATWSALGACNCGVDWSGTNFSRSLTTALSNVRPSRPLRVRSYSATPGFVACAPTFDLTLVVADLDWRTHRGGL